VLPYDKKTAEPAPSGIGRKRQGGVISFRSPRGDERRSCAARAMSSRTTTSTARRKPTPARGAAAEPELERMIFHVQALSQRGRAAHDVRGPTQHGDAQLTIHGMTALGNLHAH
jgi:hypothetical protein